MSGAIAPYKPSATGIWVDETRTGDRQLTLCSAVHILYELTKSYSERGVGVHFAHLRPKHVDIFRIVGITEIVSARSGVFF